MLRGYMIVAVVAAALACQREGTPPPGERTGSPYSSGSDSGAREQRTEGTNTGIQYEAPSRIAGVLTALEQVKRQPDKQNLTALRGGLGNLEDAMRSDLRRAGLADTGRFRALSDSLAVDLGGGPGGLAKDPKPEMIQRIDARARKLIEVFQDMIKATPA